MKTGTGIRKERPRVRERERNRKRVRRRNESWLGGRKEAKRGIYGRKKKENFEVPVLIV